MTAKNRVKNPHPAQVSRTLKAAGLTRNINSGFTVTRSSGQHISYNLDRSPGARFPVALVDLPATDIDEAIKILTSAGYHAEATTLRRGTMVVVRSQAELDWIAERTERAENADSVADKLIPATSRVGVHLTAYPSHTKGVKDGTRDQVVDAAAKNLRKHDTDILDEDRVRSECLYAHITFDPRITGMVIDNPKGGHIVLLFLPIDDATPAVSQGAPADAEQPPAEGTVLPAGHTLGVPAQHADDSDARDAAAALTAAGHTPALLSGETDEDDNDMARGTGFVVVPRGGGRVQVFHLVDGVDSWHALSDQERRTALRAYRSTLRAAGWECDGRVFRCVQAWRTSPLPEGVTIAQTRGEIPAEPQRGLLSAMRGRKLADPEHVAEIYAKRCQDCKGAGCPECGYKPHREADALRETPNPDDIINAVKASPHKDTIISRIRKGGDIGRAIVYYAYGMHDSEMHTVDWDSISARLLADNPRFEVLPVSDTVHSIRDTRANLWVRTGTYLPDLQRAAEGLNAGTLQLDALGRIADTPETEDGPYLVYAQPDLGYAPDARRATLAEAQQVAEDTAAARGLDAQGLGYHWRYTALADGHARWELRSTLHWAQRTGISIEGPGPDFSLPDVPGHAFSVRVNRTSAKATVALLDDSTDTVVYTFDTWNPGAITSIAREMADTARAVAAEQEALNALDDATVYTVSEHNGWGWATQEPQRQSGTAVRARLRALRTELGAEDPHRRTKMTLTKDGAQWRTDIPAVNGSGHTDRDATRRLFIQPAVVADAGTAIMHATGDGVLAPVSKPVAQSFGTWVRPVPGHRDRVIVFRVSVGLHKRPGVEGKAAQRWDESMRAYDDVLTATGWTRLEQTPDGWIYQAPTSVAEAVDGPPEPLCGSCEDHGLIYLYHASTDAIIGTEPCTDEACMRRRETAAAREGGA